jgi:hypothetical protein
LTGPWPSEFYGADWRRTWRAATRGAKRGHGRVGSDTSTGSVSSCPTRAQERGRLESELEATALGRARTGERAQARRRRKQGGARARHSRRKSSSQGEESLRGRPNWNRRAQRAPSARELRGPDQIRVGKERIRARRGVLLGTQQRTEGDGACPGNSTATGQKERHGTQGRGSGVDRVRPGASKLGTGRESREGANGA